MTDYKNSPKVVAIQNVIEEAKRFLDKAKIAQVNLVVGRGQTTGCKETAAAKRASMDLTRALAEYRKS